MSEDLEYLMSNGLTLTTEADEAMFHECMDMAVPFTSHWMDHNNEVKVMQWDDGWEKYLSHRAALIGEEGRESYLPWNIYKDIEPNWIDGLYLKQNTGVPAIL